MGQSTVTRVERFDFSLDDVSTFNSCNDIVTADYPGTPVSRTMKNTAETVGTILRQII